MRRTMQVMAVVVGLGSALLVLSAAVLWAVLSLIGLTGGQGSPDLINLLVAAGGIAIGCGLGLSLASAAVRSLRGRRSPSLRWPTVWLWLALYAVVLIAGQALYRTDPGPLSLFLLPGLYVLAILLPVLSLMSLVARPLVRRHLDTTWREILAQVAGGAFLGTGLALALEVAVLLAVMPVAAYLLSQSVEGQAAIEAVSEVLSNPSEVPSPSILRPLLTSPTVAALILFGAAVAAPVIEETVKTLGVALMSYRRPSRARAFLWGVAGGAGFALAEGMFSAALGLSFESGWVLPIVSRAATAIVHCLAGGLVGLAWQRLIQGPQRWRALFSYLAAVVAHGAWNGLVVSMVLAQLETPAPVADPISGAVSGVIDSALSTVLTTALLLLLLVFVLLLLLLPRRLAVAESLAVVSEPDGEGEVE